MCGDTLKVFFVASKAEAFSFTKNRKAFSSLQMVWCEHNARNVLLCHLQKLWLLQIYIYFVWYLKKSKVLPCQKWCLCTVKGGSWESYTAQVVPDTVPYSCSRHSAILPKPQQQGCFMTISRVTLALWTQGKDTAGCCPSAQPAAYWSCPTCARGSLKCPHPRGWHSLCLLLCCNHPGC